MDRRRFLVGVAGLVAAPRSLAAPPRVVALATADEEARLVVVDPASGRVLGHVRTLAYPRSIETVGAHAVVAHSELGAVSIVDARTLRVAHVLRAFREPRYTAAHPAGRYAYVTDAKRGDVSALDVVRGRVVGRAHVGLLARHVTIDPRGRTLWIALGSKAERIAVVDVSAPQRPRLLRTFAPPFLAHDVGWTPDGRRVWVSSGDRDELAIHDARSARVIRRLGGDWPPQHVTFAGDRAYVTSGWSGTLWVHDVDGRALERTVVPVGSYNVQQAEDYVLTPGLGHGSLAILDRRGRILHERRIARSSHDVCIVAGDS